MMYDILTNLWTECSDLARFFEKCPESFDAGSRQAYDDLFRGTRADIRIPLWASVCSSEAGSLMDETTLKVLQAYHRFGYVPACMDFNPPDYIGELFRFLSYLCACALHAPEGSSPYLNEIPGFTESFVKTTVQKVSAGIRQELENGSVLSDQKDTFLRIAEKLNGFTESDMIRSLSGISLNGRPEGLRSEDMPPASELVCYEAFLNGPGPVIPDGEPETLFTAGRNNCGGKCPLRTVVQDGCLTSLTASGHIPLPGLRACVRCTGYRRTYLSPERLRYPMKRIGKRGEGRFQRISWDEAVETVVNEWQRITAAYGSGSRFINYGDGVASLMRPDSMMKRLLCLDGGFLAHYGSYSSIQASTATPYLFGDNFCGHSIEDLANTKYLILWAHNPVETIFSPQTSYYITEAKKRGARVIVIDPRRSDTAMKLADEWIPVRPSTDAALAVSMAYCIVSEGLQDQDFLDRCCLGFDAEQMPGGVPASLNLRAYLYGEQDGIPKTPEWGESVTGIPAETIRRLAREYATTKPACILAGLGVQRTANGEQSTRAIAMLTCLTGNVGIEGGGAAGAGWVREEDKPVYPTGTNPYPGQISCFTWTDAVKRGTDMTPADGVRGLSRLSSNIKLLFSLASNMLINQHSDINATDALLKDESLIECIVCSDVFMTPSARYADILLPAPSFLEEDNISSPWRSGHYLLSNRRLVTPLFESRNEYAWIGDLAKRLGLFEEWADGHHSREDWIRGLYESFREKHGSDPVYNGLPAYDAFRDQGGYAYTRAKPYVAYRRKVRDPERHPFDTPSGKIELFSKTLHDRHDPLVPGLPAYVPAEEGFEDPLKKTYPLQLIGWHTRRRCHTIHDNNPVMERLEPQRLWIHPGDAAARDLHNEDLAEILNDRGRILIRVTVTDRIMQGTVAIPQGAWFTPGKDGIDRRGNLNVLTAYRPSPLAKGNPQHTNLVEVRKA